MIEICQKQTMFFLNWYSIFINFKECKKNFSSFWQLDAKFIYKIKYFFGQKSNFVSLAWKFDNPYYHNIQTRHQAKWQAYDKLRQMKYSTPFWLLHTKHTHKQLFFIYLLCCFSIYILDFTLLSTLEYLFIENN